MAKSKKSSLNRRNFLKNAVGGVAAMAATTQAADAQQSNPPGPASEEIETGGASEVEELTTDRSGSDFMVDVIKALDIEYIASTPGSSFRGLQESIINYGGNKNPEFLTCLHEEFTTALAHGYAKIEGKPMGTLVLSTIGTQHASMSIFNAFCDQAPVFVMLGENARDADKREPGGHWTHVAQDCAEMVREYIKWDDFPASLAAFADSAARAYKIAMTPPMGPAVVVVESEMQENPIPSRENGRLRVPKVTLPSPPQGDSGAVAEAARMLVAAENPVIASGRVARTSAGMKHLVELAEALQAPVIDQAGRMNFPTRHPLNQTGNNRAMISKADVLLGLQVSDFWGTVHAFRDQMNVSYRSIAKPDVKLISITSDDLYTKSNYQRFQRYQHVDLAIAADPEATLPSLTEAVKRLINADRKRVFQERGARLAEAHQKILERVRTEATYGWDASPVGLNRLFAELWAQIKDKDWSMVGSVRPWALRLWNFDKHYQYIGGGGGGGLGYTAPAAVGAALANRKRGRLSVAVVPDGDMMFTSSVLWTAAHHRIPLLFVMFNNRAYHEEVMHIQRMANRHNRGITNAHIGTVITDPNIDFAKLAQSLGVHGQGPITNPQDVGPAIRRAVEIVEHGEAALVDVVCQPK